MKKVMIFFVFGLFMAYEKFYAQGCSQCKLLAEQSSELDEASFGTNINWGILYLMIIPYLLLLFLFRKKIAQFFKGLLSR